MVFFEILSFLNESAINKMLLGKWFPWLTSLDSDGSLERSQGREGPARTTLSLVKNWSNDLLSPVDFLLVKVSKMSSVVSLDWLILLDIELHSILESKKLVLLSLGPVGENVMVHVWSVWKSRSLRSEIVLSDHRVGCLPSSDSLVHLLGVFVVLSEARCPS